MRPAARPLPQDARTDEGRRLYGYIPLMASSSAGQLGALKEESFCERVLSCANNVLTEGNTLLNDAELDRHPQHEPRLHEVHARALQPPDHRAALWPHSRFPAVGDDG